MSIVGRIDSLWRYPVKSMRGEELDEAFVGFSGVHGDRLFAFKSTGCPSCIGLGSTIPTRPPSRPIWPKRRPPLPGLNPLPADPADLAVEVETPSGEVLAVDDPALALRLTERMGDRHSLYLVRSERALTDCRPVSLFSIQTARQLGDEIGAPVDKRRFRANVYLDLGSATGFGEDGFVGRTLRLGKGDDRRARARCALQDDHDRSRDSRAERRDPAPGQPRPRRHGRRLWRRAGGGHGATGR